MGTPFKTVFPFSLNEPGNNRQTLIEKIPDGKANR